MVWTASDFVIAGILLAIGVGLWALTWLLNRALHSRKTYLKHPEELSGQDDDSDAPSARR